MNGKQPTQSEYPIVSDAIPAEHPGMRTDLNSMLMPFFPEGGNLTSFSTEVDGCTVEMSTKDGIGQIATSADRKILNLLAARIGAMIRSGNTPSRHVWIETRDIIDALACDGVVGGTEYQRVTERLERLHATRIVTERKTGPGTTKRRVMNWIDAFEQDISHSPGGRKIIGLKISLSEDAYHWITRNEGFDLSREHFHSLTATRSSAWRIYEICLAQLLRCKGEPTRIPLDELRCRVPISSDLKVFKARTLKQSMKVIADSPQMSHDISLSLERRTATSFVPIDFSSKRAPLSSIYVRIERGNGPLPRLDRLIVDDIAVDADRHAAKHAEGASSQGLPLFTRSAHADQTSENTM